MLRHTKLQLLGLSKHWKPSSNNGSSRIDCVTNEGTFNATKDDAKGVHVAISSAIDHATLLL